MKKSFWLCLLVFSVLIVLNSCSTDYEEKEKKAPDVVDSTNPDDEETVKRLVVYSKKQLKDTIYKRMKDAGYKGKVGDPGTDIDLNDIDISNLKELEGLFSNINLYSSPYLNHFNGDISNWKVDNVTNMQRMFSYSQFNQDISNWKVDKVTNMQKMFENSQFNQDISNWNVDNVTDMKFMFNYADNFDNGGKPDGLDKWHIAPNVNKIAMFDSSKLKSDNNIPCWDDSDLSDCPNP